MTRVEILEHYIKEQQLNEIAPTEIKRFITKFDQDIFDRWQKVRANLKSPYNNIAYLMSDEVNNIVDLEDILNNINNYSNAYQNKTKVNKGSDKIYEDKTWKIYRVFDFEAAQILGQNTKWCIIAKNRFTDGPDAGKSGREIWDEYKAQGVKEYYFYMNSNGKKYCAAAAPRGGMVEIWDETDKMVAEIPDLPNEVKEMRIPYISRIFKTILDGFARAGINPDKVHIVWNEDGYNKVKFEDGSIKNFSFDGYNVRI